MQRTAFAGRVSRRSSRLFLCDLCDEKLLTAEDAKKCRQVRKEKQNDQQPERAIPA
jgi:hypothetical protein